MECDHEKIDDLVSRLQSNANPNSRVSLVENIGQLAVKCACSAKATLVLCSTASDALDSRAVRRAALLALCSVLRARGAQKEVSLRVASVGARALADHADFVIRCRGVQVAVAAAGCEPTDNQLQLQVQGALQRFAAADPHAAVRAECLSGLLLLHRCRVPLTDATFKCAHKALDDDQEEVRVQAVKLLCLCAQLDPERITNSGGSKPGRGGSSRLVDVVFSRLGGAACDPAVKVRAEAVTRLAALPAVEPTVLMQALSKQVTAGTAAGRAADDSTGDVDITQTSDSNSVLDKSAAAGAFVHGLEDEFQEVRLATIDSLCELSLRTAQMVEKAVEFLMDMINDEMLDVRLNAVHSLTKLAAAGITVLTENMFTVILQGLEDPAGNMRSALYALLEQAKVKDAGCVLMAVRRLASGMLTQPDDEPAIAAALCGLGRHHPCMVESLVDQLLGSTARSHFLQADSSIEDPSYRAAVLLICSAAAYSPTLPALLPAYTLNHAAILQEKHSHVLPDVQFTQATAAVVDVELKCDSQKQQRVQIFPHPCSQPSESGLAMQLSQRATGAAERLRQTMEGLIATVKSGGRRRHVEAVMAQCERALLQMSDPDQSGPCLSAPAPAHLWAFRARAAALVAHAQARGLRDLEDGAAPPKRMRLGRRDAAAQLMELVGNVEDTMLGLPAEHRLTLLELRVFVHLLRLVTVSEQQAGASGRTRRETVLEIRHCAALATSLQAQLPNTAHSKFIHGVEGVASRLVDDNASADSISESALALAVLGMEYTPCKGDAAWDVRRLAARITQPVTTPERPAEYMKGLPMQVEVCASLEHIKAPHALCLQVCSTGEPTRILRLRGASHVRVEPLGVPGHSRMTALVDLPTPSQVGKCILRISLVLEKADNGNCHSGDRHDGSLPSSSEKMFDVEPVVRHVMISNVWIIHASGR